MNDDDYRDAEFEALPETKKYRKVARSANLFLRFINVVVWGLFAINVISRVSVYQHLSGKTAQYFIHKYTILYWAIEIPCIIAATVVFVIYRHVAKRHRIETDKYYATKLNVSPEKLDSMFHELEETISRKKTKK